MSTGAWMIFICPQGDIPIKPLHWTSETWQRIRQNYVKDKIASRRVGNSFTTLKVNGFIYYVHGPPFIPVVSLIYALRTEEIIELEKQGLSNVWPLKHIQLLL